MDIPSQRARVQLILLLTTFAIPPIASAEEPQDAAAKEAAAIERCEQIKQSNPEFTSAGLPEMSCEHLVEMSKKKDDFNSNEDVGQ